MEVIPAIDLRGGRCVRLYQGDYAQETVYSDDPVDAALRWQEMGAARLHVVDLDGAAQGEPVNLGVIESIARSLGIPLQIGGGIRDMGAVEKALGIGVGRVVLGTSAVGATPGWWSRRAAALGRTRSSWAWTPETGWSPLAAGGSPAMSQP